MTTEETALILRCHQLTLELIDNEPEQWATWDYHPWRQQMEHGPRYLAGRWFGPMPEYRRMRYRRAIDALEQRGLVQTHREWGSKLTNLSLTHDGLALADELLQEAAADDG